MCSDANVVLSYRRSVSTFALIVTATLIDLPILGTNSRDEVAVERHRRVPARSSWSCGRLGIREHGVRASFTRINALWHSTSAPPSCAAALAFWSTCSFSKMWAWSLSWLFGQASTATGVPSPQPDLTLRCRPSFSGFALGGTSEPESALAGFIQQAKDQVSTSFPRAPGKSESADSVNYAVPDPA